MNVNNEQTQPLQESEAESNEVNTPEQIEVNTGVPAAPSELLDVSKPEDRAVVELSIEAPKRGGVDLVLVIDNENDLNEILLKANLDKDTRTIYGTENVLGFISNYTQSQSPVDEAPAPTITGRPTGEVKDTRTPREIITDLRNASDGNLRLILGGFLDKMKEYNY